VLEHTYSPYQFVRDLKFNVLTLEKVDGFLRAVEKLKNGRKRSNANETQLNYAGTSWG